MEQISSTEYFRSDVPPGKSGAWTIEKILIRNREYDPAADPRPDCFKFRPGVYTCLSRNSTQFMTDLYDEWWTQRAGVAEALARGGDVLITGLGLGLVAEAMLRPTASRINRITIVELSADVIALVAPLLRSRYAERIEIVQGDAFSWTPTGVRRFTVGWHDIWPDPYAAEIPREMASLKAHHGQWCDWQGFWPQAYLEVNAGDAQQIEAFYATASLRPATQADHDFLRRVYTSTRTEELAVTDWTNEQKAAFCRMQFDAQDAYYRANYPTAQFLVIEREGAPAGRLYVDRWEKEIRIMDITLLPEHRRFGIGTKLIRELQQEAATAAKSLTIHVEKFNPALRLYERLGFRPKEDKGVYLLMEWKEEEE